MKTLTKKDGSAFLLDLSKRPRLLTMDLAEDVTELLDGAVAAFPFRLDESFALAALSNLTEYQRQKTESNVTKLAKDIVENRFKLSTDCVALTAEMELLGGRHRLEAFVNAIEAMRDKGDPRAKTEVIDVMVMFNTPPSAAIGANQQQPQRLVDYCRTLGVNGMSQVKAQVLRRTMTGVQQRLKLSLAEQLDFYREGRHRDAVDFAYEQVYDRHRLFLNQSLKTPTTAAVMARAYIVDRSRERLLEFIDVLKGGINDGSPLHRMLGDYAAKHAAWGSGSRDPRDPRYCLTDIVLRAFLDREPLQRSIPRKCERQLGDGTWVETGPAVKFLGLELVSNRRRVKPNWSAYEEKFENDRLRVARSDDLRTHVAGRLTRDSATSENTD